MRTRDPRSYAPRGLRRDDAAAWIGLSPTKFDEMVKDGRMPQPVRMDGCVVWDRYGIDAAFDVLLGEGAPDPWSGVTA
jgi:predicted DNA-binding transcriptional regulator AlpA